MERADLRFEVGDYQSAIRDTRDAIALNPELIDAHVLCGRAYAQVGQLVSATREYSRAIDLNPRVGRYYRLRAKSYEVLGKDADAGSDFAAALRLDPNDYDSDLHLAWLYAASSDNVRIRSTFETHYPLFLYGWKVPREETFLDSALSSPKCVVTAFIFIVGVFSLVHGLATQVCRWTGALAFELVRPLLMVSQTDDFSLHAPSRAVPPVRDRQFLFAHSLPLWDLGTDKRR
jgi:hypothetical protein